MMCLSFGCNYPLLMPNSNILVLAATAIVIAIVIIVIFARRTILISVPVGPAKMMWCAAGTFVPC